LSVACPSCGASNPGGQRFCDACGTALGDEERSASATGSAVVTPELAPDIPSHLAEKIRAGRGSLEGERKQVTVLFADVMGSMELAEQTDAEEWRRVMERFFAILCEGIHRFEGTVDKFTGDGIMALFGAPIAHEDHAQRACYAALHLQHELSSYSAELRRELGLSFSVRIGLNSGEVVVGAIDPNLAMDYTAVGHTVGLAQRMEQLAEPGKAYLTDQTASVAEGYLALADLGEHSIKGVTRAVRVYELAGVGAARGRLDISRARGFSRFVGREDELGILEAAFERALSGQGQVIGIVGEAGVGKSRLCHEFAERHRAKGMSVYQISGQSHATSVPLLPVLQLLRAYFDISELDSEQTARERIAGKLLLMDESFADDLPLMFDFLGVPDPERRPPLMNPEARQRQLLGLTRRLTHAESVREPVINVFEDLHWVDPASEVFLSSHIEAIHSTRSLTVVNFRPEYQASWMSKSYYRQIALSPLDPAAIEAMLAELLGSHPSLVGLPELIRLRTAGNPFFVEEVVQSLIESGNLEGERGAYTLTRPIGDATVPASVQAVLSARIDRLPKREKAVLQAAAVIGKEFAEPLLASVVELAGVELEETLRALVAAEFIYEQELYPELIYAFVHPLTQEVAYGSQLGERRASVHAAVATNMTTQYPDRLDELAALLAYHWQSAKVPLEAARWHARAAAWSGTSDPMQSLRHWREVQELADSAPESDEATSLSLTARIFRLQFSWRLGISHEEAEAVFHEAEQMAAKAGDVRSRALLLATYGSIVGVNDGNVEEYANLARRAVALAEESGNSTLYMAVAPASYGIFCISEAREAVAILDRAIELADGDATLAAGLVVACPLAFCHIFKGGMVSYLGKLDEARHLIERGMKIAREHGDVETVGWGHMWATWVAHLVGDPAGMLAHAQQAVEIAERLGDAFSRAWAWSWLGIAKLEQGDWKQSIDALERSMAISTERRTAVEGADWRLGMLAEAWLGAGDAERARPLAEEAVQLARSRGRRHFEVLALLSFARVVIGASGAAERDDVEAVLEQARQLSRDSDAPPLEAMVHLELAELARHAGDEAGRQRHLGVAQGLFAEMGAGGRVERVTRELAVA
jgi:class 3 adenylate cyclase/tetratricopeptide (TPR) repeat protein